jgi:hypothetical protein
MTLPLNPRETMTETGKESGRRRGRETKSKNLGLSSTSEWIQRIRAAKRDTKSDAGHRLRRKTGNHRALRGRSRNFSASLEREKNGKEDRLPLSWL